MTALIITGYFLLIMILIILALVLIPIDYSAQGQKYESASIQVNVSSLFGGVVVNYSRRYGYSAESCVKMLCFRLRKKTKDVQKKIKEEKKHKKEKGKINFLNKDFLKRVFEAIGDFLNHIKPRRLEVNGVFGFDGPYDTSIVWLFILAMPLHDKNFNIKLHPVFDDEVFEGRFVIEGRIVLAVVLWIAVKLMLSQPVRNIKKERKRRIYAN